VLPYRLLPARALDRCGHAAVNLHPLAFLDPLHGIRRPEGTPPVWAAGRAARGTLRRVPGSAADGDAPDDTECRQSIRSVVETQIIPRLLLAHRRGSDGAPAASSAPVRAEDIAALARLCAAGDLTGAVRAVDALRKDGLDPDRVLLELLGPAAMHLGQMWDDDATSFAEVTLGLGLLHELIHAMGYEFDAGPQQAATVRRVLLASAPGSQHLLGLAIVSEIYRKAGWDVVMEVSTDRADLCRVAAGEWFDLVGVSVALDAQLPALPALVAGLRQASKNAAVPVLLGGPIFSLRELGATPFGAQAVCVDARLCVAISEALLAS
jgi:MerR family transcriptional regulator, light-induced transcriptional regulator